jgi:hypothetical protein
MKMRKYLSTEHREWFDNCFRKALSGTADARQAESIAMERTLFKIMRASAEVAHNRAWLKGALTNPDYPWARR